MFQRLLLAALLVAAPLAAQSPKDLVNTMVAHELDAAAHRQFFAYLSNERSERTGGHLWTEHVVETPQGRIRFLMAIDGQPLSPDAASQERGRLANIVANPDAFVTAEKAEKDDEAHARAMMQLLAKAFVLETPRPQGTDLRIDFRPDPAYSPSGTEEKVLHAMSGYLLIDQKQTRLHHIEGRMPADLSLAMGLATVKAGSNFASDKAETLGHWRTIHVISDIHGKAVLFKTIAKNTDVTRTQFHLPGANLTLAQAVALAEQPPTP